jgi:hypothetical protein
MSADARVSLEQVFDSIPGLDDKWRSLILEAFDAERVREVSTAITCKCCGKERKYMVKVHLPNWADRAKALDMLLTQAKGKPVETKTIDLNLFAAQTRGELEQMSDDELALMAATADRKELTDGTQGKPPAARKPAASRKARGRKASTGKAAGDA